MKHLPAIRRNHTAMARSMEHPFESMQRNMDGIFKGLFRDMEGFRLPSMEWLSREPGLITPKFEVSETGDAFHVKAELPGLEEKDIELSVDHDTLVLKGEKKQEREEKRKNGFFSEKSYGQYYRSYPMPWGVDAEKIKAAFRKGVLTVCLPKMEKSKIERRKLKITCE